MATFLVTKKMDPALAERVEASVHGARGGARGQLRPRTVRLMRLAVAVCVVGVAWGVTDARRRERVAIETSRAELLAEVRTKSASLTSDDLAYLARAQAWLGRLAGAYEGDFIDDALKAPGAMGDALERPAVYVRGPIDDFTTLDGTKRAAAASAKDALAMCLVDPPSSRTEKAALAKVRSAYAKAGELEKATASMRRLFDVDAGLEMLGSWVDRVKSAREEDDIDALREELEKAPIDSAVRGAKSSLLVVAMDEAGDGTGPTELDGERPHAVRVGLVDLTASKLLLRVRRDVDPGWISSSKRAVYASGIDSCALAFDVREAAGSGSFHPTPPPRAE